MSENFPGGHAVHKYAPFTEIYPAAQRVQVSEAEREYVPAGQASQILVKSPAEKVPALQGVQTLFIVAKPGSQYSAVIIKVI